MNHFWSYLCDHLPALVAAVTAAVAAWKSHAALQGVEANRATSERRFREIALRFNDVQAAQAASTAGAPGAADVPGLSIADALRYWDLIGQIKATWGRVKRLPVGVRDELPLIKTKIDGRHVELGPTPLVFRD